MTVYKFSDIKFDSIEKVFVVAAVQESVELNDFKEFEVETRLYYANTLDEIEVDAFKSVLDVINKDSSVGLIDFGITLSKSLLEKCFQLTKVSITINENLWSKTNSSDRCALKQSYKHQYFITNDRNQVEVKIGINGLHILKQTVEKSINVNSDIFWTYDSVYELKEINHNEMFVSVKERFIDIVGYYSGLAKNQSGSLEYTIVDSILTSIKKINSVELNLSKIDYSGSFGTQQNFVVLFKNDFAIDCFNKLSYDEAKEVLSDIAVSKKFTSLMINGRPYRTVKDVLNKAEEIYVDMNDDDWKEEFAGKARLGGAKTKMLIEEFKQIKTQDELLKELDLYQDQYESKFKHIFMISVANKTLSQIVTALKSRLNYDEKTEWNQCVHELKTIKRIRIPKVFTLYGQLQLAKQNTNVEK